MSVNLKFIPANEYCERIFDGTHSSPKEDVSGKHKLVTSKNILTGKMLTDDAYYISDKDYNDIQKRSAVHKNDILFSMIGTIGNICFINEEPNYAIKNMGVFRCKNLDDAKWLYLYLRSDIAKAHIDALMNGSIQKFVALGKLEEFPILEKPSNWKEIVNIIENIDNQIQRNNDMVQKLQVLAQSTYSRWFNQFEFPNEEGFSYKTNGGKFEYNKELKREIPTDWKVENLYFIADYVNGLACQKHRPLDENKKLPVIKITEMHNGITSETEFVRSDVDEKYIINNGDILFSWSATLETMLWCGGKGVLNQHIFKVNSKNNFSDSFVFLQLSNYIINFVKIAEARKTTMGHITTEHLKQSKIIVPPINVIEKFDAICKPLFEQIIILNKENIELNNFKSKLLPLLINGQLEV